MSSKWFKFSTGWVRYGGMTGFKGGRYAGESLAALKCLVALSRSADFNSRIATASLSDLQDATGLSRPMVIKGIRSLEKDGFILRNEESHVGTYLIDLQTWTTDDYWTKLPYDMVGKALPSLPNRGSGALAALKIYIYLASIRPNREEAIYAKYETIRQHTNIQQKHVRVGLDLLIEHHLLRVSRTNEDGKLRRNEYQIIGLRL